MKRLLIIQPSLAPYRIDFFNLLAEYYEVKLLLLKDNFPDNPFDQEQLRGSLNFPTEVIKNVLYLRKRLFPLGFRKQINSFKPDLVLCSEFSIANNLVLAHRFFSFAKFKVVTLTDDNELMVGRRGHYLKRFNQWLLIRMLDGIITLDIPEVLRYYTSLAGSSRVIGVQHLIRNGEVFRKKLILVLEKYEGNITEKPRKPVRLLFVGRLVPEKGLGLLVGSFRKLVGDHAGISLYIVGEGTEKQKIECMIREYGLTNSIFLEGRKEGDELLRYYLESDIFVLPSNYEPFGAVVNEALLAGVPVVCSDRVGAKCLIEPETSGSIFRFDDPESLVSAIRYWLKRPGQTSENELRANFMTTDAKREVGKLINFLNKLVQK